MKLSLAVRNSEDLVAPSGSSTTSGNAFVLQDTTVAGGVFRFGRSDFNGIVEGLYIGKRTAGISDSYSEFAFGLKKS